jgi:hypothetical protein
LRTCCALPLSRMKWKICCAQALMLKGFSRRAKEQAQKGSQYNKYGGRSGWSGQLSLPLGTLFLCRFLMHNHLCIHA